MSTFIENVFNFCLLLQVLWRNLYENENFINNILVQIYLFLFLKWYQTNLKNLLSKTILIHFNKIMWLKKYKKFV